MSKSVFFGAGLAHTRLLHRVAPGVPGVGRKSLEASFTSFQGRKQDDRLLVAICILSAPDTQSAVRDFSKTVALQTVMSHSALPQTSFATSLLQAYQAIRMHSEKGLLWLVLDSTTTAGICKPTAAAVS